MASVSILSWQIDVETVETVIEFILGGLKITADGDCSHEIIAQARAASRPGLCAIAPGSWLQSPSAVILEPPKIKSATVSTVSTSICYEVMRPDAVILVF